MSGEITITSTTDSQEQVEAALDADEATGYQETPPNDDRSSTIITTTTDSPDELDQAMYGPDEPHARNGSIVQPIERPSRVASTTDPPEEVERVAAELKEDQEQRPDYLGRPRRAEKRIAQLVREREEYRARSEALSAELQNRQQQTPQRPQPQPNAWQQAHARQYTPQEQQSAVEAYRAAQVRIAEEEKVFVERHPDYIESVRRLEPGHESPIPPTSYYHLMLNIPNAPDVGYYLSRHPETIAKLWSLETSGQGIKVMEELNHISSGLRFQANATQSGASAAARRERQPNSGPPAPIRPVGGSSHSAGPNIANPNLDYQSYKRLMAEQARSKGRQW